MSWICSINKMSSLTNMLTSSDSNYREPIQKMTRKRFANIFHHTVPTVPVYILQERNPLAVALLPLLLPLHLQPLSHLGIHHSQLYCLPPLVSCHLLHTSLDLSGMKEMGERPKRPKINCRFSPPYNFPFARRFLQLLPPSRARQHDLEVWDLISDHISVTTTNLEVPFIKNKPITASDKPIFEVQ